MEVPSTFDPCATCLTTRGLSLVMDLGKCRVCHTQRQEASNRTIREQALREDEKLGQEIVQEYQASKPRALKLPAYGIMLAFYSIYIARVWNVNSYSDMTDPRIICFLYIFTPLILLTVPVSIARALNIRAARKVLKHIGLSKRSLRKNDLDSELARCNKKNPASLRLIGSMVRNAREKEELLRPSKEPEPDVQELLRPTTYTEEKAPLLLLRPVE